MDNPFDAVLGASHYEITEPDSGHQGEGFAPDWFDNPGFAYEMAANPDRLVVLSEIGRRVGNLHLQTVLMLKLRAG